MSRRISKIQKRQKRQKKLAAFCAMWLRIVSWFIRAVQTVISIRLDMCPHRLGYKMFNPDRKEHMRRLVYESDETCLQQLRMNRSAFVALCNMLERGGKLNASKYVEVDEQVAIFLYILAHHVKNRVARFQFRRSGETISTHFNNVLNAVLRLENELFKKPEPIPETSTDERWKWFKGCLGAIDGTHINVQVPEEDKPRYRNRKGDITTNVLAACTPDMQFIYVLPGWEGSAADGRILRSAMIRDNGLQVPKGKYYLVDAGYTNGEGFLAPFRGQRYHLNTWLNGRRPEKPEEYFNMKLSAARNVIERCFGVLKKRWAIQEDEKLVAAMIDVLNSGSNYKSDNGFKPGFSKEVEKQLAISLPEAGIKAKPHIESRLKSMKSDWSAVHDMLSWNNTSGFGWDYQNNMFEAPQAVWQAYVQVHKSAAKWRGKQLPHYWDLCIVFGKDRANGRDSQTAADIVSDMNREEEANRDGLDDLDTDQSHDSPSFVSYREESSTQRKRKRRNSWDPLMNSLKESAEIIGAEIREATNTFNRVFGTESNREEMRHNLFAEMNKVLGLTPTECDRAVCKLARNEELMVVFFKVDEDRKFQWVLNMLDDTP